MYNLNGVILAWVLIFYRHLPLRAPENHKNLGKVDSIIDNRNTLFQNKKNIYTCGKVVNKVWYQVALKRRSAVWELIQEREYTN